MSIAETAKWTDFYGIAVRCYVFHAFRFGHERLNAGVSFTVMPNSPHDRWVFEIKKIIAIEMLRSFVRHIFNIVRLSLIKWCLIQHKGRITSKMLSQFDVITVKSQKKHLSQNAILQKNNFSASTYFLKKATFCLRFWSVFRVEWLF